MSRGGGSAGDLRRAAELTRRVEVLCAAAALICEANAQRRQCVEAVAVLAAVADLLGVRCQPLPMAVVAETPRRRTPRTTVLLGEDAFALAREHFGMAAPDAPADSSDFPGWSGAGHLVLWLPGAKFFIDPTIDQLSALTGLRVGPVSVAVESLDRLLDGAFICDAQDIELGWRHVPRDDTWPHDAAKIRAAALPGEARIFAREALAMEFLDKSLVAPPRAGAHPAFFLGGLAVRP